MKTVVTFLVIIVAIASCSKDAAPKQQEITLQAKFENILGKYMVADSLVKKEPGKVTVVSGGEDMTLHKDGTMEARFGPWRYELVKPDTLYIWPGTSSVRGTDRYFIIKMPTERHLILSEKITDFFIHEFHFTAK